MNRRDFILVLGGVAAVPRLARAQAQRPAMPVVGFLNTTSPDIAARMVAAFREGLAESGFVEGRNLAVEYRWTHFENERLPALATELAGLPVTVIVSTGGVIASLAAKAATSVIPIVFISGDDPIKHGLVASLTRPEGNLTGISFLITELGAKRLELLHEMVPQAAEFDFLLNPDNVELEGQRQQVERAARAFGLRSHILTARSDSEFEAAFAPLKQRRAVALLVASDPLFTSRRDQIVALAARYAVPAIYSSSEFAAAGGLMSYGTSRAEAYRQAGIYAAKILNGAKPADLPVIQPTKFELVINLKTAKALGLTVPSALLARADEVIE